MFITLFWTDLVTFRMSSDELDQYSFIGVDDMHDQSVSLSRNIKYQAVIFGKKDSRSKLRFHVSGASPRRIG
jgi:hypothetical protein